MKPQGSSGQLSRILCATIFSVADGSEPSEGVAYGVGESSLGLRRFAETPPTISAPEYLGRHKLSEPENFSSP